MTRLNLCNFAHYTITSLRNEVSIIQPHINTCLKSYGTLILLQAQFVVAYHEIIWDIQIMHAALKISCHFYVLKSRK
jgi:hypothetical protein